MSFGDMPKTDTNGRQPETGTASRSDARTAFTPKVAWR
jgi:hypothetical protein